MSKSADDSHPLCQHLDSLVDELRQRIPKALDEFEEEGIHKARVTTRRLKAAIELLAPCLDEDHARPFAKLGKKLRRRLGPLRDLDVLLGHLAAIQPAKLQPAVAWFCKHLEQQREQSRDRLRDRKSPNKLLAELGSWWGVRPDVINAEGEIPKLLRDSVHRTLGDFQKLASGLGAGTDPHALRIAGKALRYTLELAQAQGFEIQPSLLKTFKRMQELLGAWHDYVVLAERAMLASIEEELALHQSPLQRNVLALADFAMRRAELELSRFQTLWADRGDELADTIRAVMGIEVKASKTDRGPENSATPPTPAPPAEASPPTA